MENLININETFEKIIKIKERVANKEFEDCVFEQCDFSDSDFQFNTFQDCKFVNCNLSMLILANSSLKTVEFINCKLLGIDFSKCTDFLFEVSFQDCILDYAVFAYKKMPKTNFGACSMKEVNFVGTNLTNSNFENCNLENAIFNETILAGANFTSATNYKIDPEFNPMKKAKFATAGILGLLEKYDIRIE